MPEFSATKKPTIPAQTEARGYVALELTARQKRFNAACARSDEAHRAWCLASNGGHSAEELATLWLAYEVAWIEAIAEREPGMADYELSRSLSRVVVNGMTIEDLLIAVAGAVSVAGAEYPAGSGECKVHVFVSDALRKFAAEKMPAVREKYTGGNTNGD